MGIQMVKNKHKDCDNNMMTMKIVDVRSNIQHIMQRMKNSLLP